MSWKTISRNRPGLLAAAAGAALALGAGAAFPQVIAVEQLEPVDPFSVGILSQREGGLPQSLWRGSTAALAREAMTRLPANSQSPAVNGLIAHTLLSGGEPPEGGADESAALAALRLEALIAAGLAADAARLAARTPDIADNAVLAEAQARGELLGGDLDAACGTADALREGRDATFWLRLRAVCLASAGQTARADLTAQLARQETERSEQFERAYALAVLGEAPDEEVQTADPLVYAAAVRSGAMIALPASAPRAMRMSPLPNAEPVAAAADATAAARVGLVGPARVVSAYEAIEPPEPEGDADERFLLDAALDAEPGLREALLYRIAADRAAPGGQRAEALAASLESAEDAPAFIVAATVLAEALGDLPVEDGRDDALLFAEAAAAAGDSSAAARWLEAATTRPLRREPDRDAETGAPEPLGVREPWDPPDEDAVAAARALVALYEDSPEAAADRLAEETGDPEMRLIDAVVLDAMGKEGGAALRLALLEGAGLEGERADPDTLLAAEAAARAGAMAETALFAAAAMAPGPAALAPADLSRVLRALVRAGLERDARAAGLEAMLAARR